MQKKRRSINQVKEEISVSVLRKKLPREWVIHSYGSDYGIDCVVELFDFIDDSENIAETLGENFFVQLKSSDCIEYTSRKAYTRGNVAKGCLTENKGTFVEIPVIKFQLNMSDILTVQSIGIAIPVLLILVDTKTERAYFICLNDYIDKVLIPEDPEYFQKNTKTIYIPIENEIFDDRDALVPLRVYGKRSKMYGAFSLFSYQLKEIERIQGKTVEPHLISFDNTIKMIKHFTIIALKQDIWSGHEFWEPMLWSYKELLELEKNIDKEVKSENHEYFLSYCSEYVWHRLTNLSNMYEEIVREWFMPTYLATLTSSRPKEKQNDSF